MKTSAAWLIDHAGFHKGFAVTDVDAADVDAGAGATPADAPASLSTLHTLALTNRGTAATADVVALAKTIQQGVKERFGVALVPEPVCIGIDLRP